jgi:hypothetical protein
LERAMAEGGWEAARQGFAGKAAVSTDNEN